MSSRKIKQQVLALLSGRDLAFTLQGLRQWPTKDVVNVLFSAICREDSSVRWHAISCMGATVARLADEDMEEARIIMRRLLWSLNDESGGIGWGAPECLAEIMCGHAGLVKEYVHMLVSYLREDGEEICQDGNYIEHPLLQRGILWGIARLSRCNPELLLQKSVGPEILPYLAALDAETRGLAVLAAGALQLLDARSSLRKMITDCTPLTVYQEGVFLETTVGRLSQSALEAMNG